MKRLSVWMFICLMPALLYAGSGVPEWFLNPSKAGNYPASNYIIGVGTGNTLDAAKNNAAADIQKQITVSISSKQTSQISSEQTGQTEKYKERITRKSRAMVKGSLKKVSFVKTAAAAGKFYAAAVLDKRVFLSELRRDIDPAYEKAQAQYSNAEDYLDNRHNIGQYAKSMRRALAFLKRVNAKVSLYNAISAVPYPETLKITEVENAIQRIAPGIELKILSKREQTVLQNNRSVKPFIIKAEYTDEAGGLIPLAALKVRAIYENGKEIGTFASNDSGIVSVSFFAFRLKKGKQSFHIKFIPQINGMDYTGAAVSAVYRVKLPDKKPAVSVVIDASPEVKKDIQAKVYNALDILGIQVDAAADKTLVANAKLEKAAALGGFAGGLKYFNLALNFILKQKDGTEISRASEKVNVFANALSGIPDLSSIELLKTQFPDLFAIR